MVGMCRQFNNYLICGWKLNFDLIQIQSTKFEIQNGEMHESFETHFLKWLVLMDVAVSTRDIKSHNSLSVFRSFARSLMESS